MSNTTTHRSLPFSTVDVFAERPLEGNQLAIFHDAHGLSTEDMQAIARETNLSETTFILPRDPATELADGVQVRIFTTEEELPFAGHPTLGTATWIRLNLPHFHNAPNLRLKLAVGHIPVTFDPPSTDPAIPPQPGLFATMQQPDPTFGRIHDPAAVAHALGLTPADLDPDLPIQTVSTGVPFCIVPLRSLTSISRLAVPQNLARQYLQYDVAKFFFCLTPADPASGAHWHARMQFANTEDPATGSASGCAIAWLVRHGLVPPNQPTILEQGIEIRRPSRIHVRATLSGDTVTGVFVGGRTIPVATGHLFLPFPESYAHLPPSYPL